MGTYKKLMISFGLCFSGGFLFANTAPVVTAYGITNLADCIHRVPDFAGTQQMCISAYQSAEAMAQQVANILKAQPTSTFTFYVTPPDPSDPDSAQTLFPCGIGSNVPGTVEGGIPLCHLVQYASDVGNNSNFLETRDFATYFTLLLNGSLPNITLIPDFQTGSSVDPLVMNVGESGYSDFEQDNQGKRTPYFPDPSWQKLLGYGGMSGGGGSGWGGEIKVQQPTGLVTLLSFGGGGGVGMTSSTNLYVGGGGGGGMQFANGATFNTQNLNGLGLGAGAGADNQSSVQPVQYSYSTAGGASSTTTHEYSPGLIGNYQSNLTRLATQLQILYGRGRPIFLTGGGGMGVGMEYLDTAGNEEVPHALSSQGGFAYTYTFASLSTAVPQVNDPLPQGFYAKLGNIYHEANTKALQTCGNTYSNYSCICFATQAWVLNLSKEAYSGALPTWLSQAYCPATDAQLSTLAPNTGINAYQQFTLDILAHSLTSGAILDQAGESGASVTQNLLEYFQMINAPNPDAIEL